MHHQIPWLAAAVLVSGCAATPHTERATLARGAPPLALPANLCPTTLPDVSVQASDTPRGIALEFQTQSDLEALRARVERLAAAENRRNEHARTQLVLESNRRTIARALPPGVDTKDVFKASGPGGPNTGMDSKGPSLGNDVGRKPELEFVIPAQARVVRTPNGARLELVPEDPANLEGLRAVVRERAPLLRSGECPALA